MPRSIAILLVGWLVAGCTSGRISPDREALIRETADEASWEAPRSGPIATPGAFPVAPQEKPAEEEAPKKSPMVSGREVPPQDEMPKWRRAGRDAEIAIIRDHMNWSAEIKKERAPRVHGVTGYFQLVFAAGDDALEGFFNDDPQWDELFDDGWGAGFEYSYELMPALQPLVGIKYDYFKGDTDVTETGTMTYLRETNGLRTIPAYVGLRLNFPLNLEMSQWFDAGAAGSATGVIPYLKVGGGAAFVFGNEFEVVDVVNSITTTTDFIKNGFTSYVEGAVGIEYRTADGFAVRFSVGIEVYPDLKLDSDFENAYPGVDLESLKQAVLPRISASFYF